MTVQGFKEWLQEQGISDETTLQINILISEFASFLDQKGSTINRPTYQDVHDFSSYLIEHKKNIFDNFIYILRLGYFYKSNDMILAIMEIIDGGEVMFNFSTRLEELFGKELRDQIFEGEMPPLGLHPKDRPLITKRLIDKFLSVVPREKCKELLNNGLRDKYIDSYKPDREKYLELNNFTEFLVYKKKKLKETLTNHMNEGSLFFTQEIDQSVIDYVQANPSIESGIREGNKLIITKIPYMAKEFITETDPEKKKYYYCHCPWVREGLQDKSFEMDPIFCNCSAGFYKNYWEYVLDSEVTVEPVESILMGNDTCKFVVTLPDYLVKRQES